MGDQGCARKPLQRDVVQKLRAPPCPRKGCGLAKVGLAKRAEKHRKSLASSVSKLGFKCLIAIELEFVIAKMATYLTYYYKLLMVFSLQTNRGNPYGFELPAYNTSFIEGFALCIGWRAVPGVVKWRARLLTGSYRALSRPAMAIPAGASL
jgi:hypothetical protein